MRHWWVAPLIALGWIAVSAPGFAADGDLDPTFGIQGKIFIPVNGSHVASIAAQPDGRIVLAGTLLNGTDLDLNVRRYARDGTPDATFGAAGSVVTPMPGAAYAARGLVQSDGKIVVAGRLDDGSDDDVFVARYETTGALDPSFGSGGIVTVSGPEQTAAYDAVLQGDGKIVVAGRSAVAGLSEDILVMRFDPDGAPDSTFGSGGLVLTDLSDFDIGNVIALQADGALVVGGKTLAAGVVVRYQPDGTPDPTFGTGGAVVLGTPGAQVFGVVPQAGGSVVAGLIKSRQSTLFRFDSSGAPDATFGAAGSASVPLDAIFPLLGAEPAGKLLIAGSIANTLAVVRFDTDGQFDPTLSVCGAALTAFEGDNMSFTTAFAVQPDGRFLLSSHVLRDLNNLDDFESYAAVARFGTPATTVCTPAVTGKSRLAFKGGAGAKWKWTGPGTLADFGTPDLGTDVTLCVVDPVTGAPYVALTAPGTTSFCDHSTCWRARSNGFTGMRSGIVLGKLRMKMIASTTGTVKLVMSSKAGFLYLGLLASYPQPLPLTARMKRGDGAACWEATYSTAVKNSSETGFLAFAD